jgi:hypothetical protein
MFCPFWFTKKEKRTKTFLQQNSRTCECVVKIKMQPFSLVSVERVNIKNDIHDNERKIP